jgi:hypothetical protein
MSLTRFVFQACSFNPRSRQLRAGTQRFGRPLINAVKTRVQLVSRPQSHPQALNFQWFREWDLRGLATNIICSFGAQQLESFGAFVPLGRTGRFP